MISASQLRTIKFDFLVFLFMLLFRYWHVISIEFLSTHYPWNLFASDLILIYYIYIPRWISKWVDIGYMNHDKVDHKWALNPYTHTHIYIYIHVHLLYSIILYIFSSFLYPLSSTEVQGTLRRGGGRGLRRHAAGEFRRSRRRLGGFWVGKYWGFSWEILWKIYGKWMV